jgi:hypothetical protein
MPASGQAASRSGRLPVRRRPGQAGFRSGGFPVRQASGQAAPWAGRLPARCPAWVPQPGRGLSGWLFLVSFSCERPVSGGLGGWFWSPVSVRWESIGMPAGLFWVVRCWASLVCAFLGLWCALLEDLLVAPKWVALGQAVLGFLPGSRPAEARLVGILLGFSGRAHWFFWLRLLGSSGWCAPCGGGSGAAVVRDSGGSVGGFGRYCGESPPVGAGSRGGPAAVGGGSLCWWGYAALSRGGAGSGGGGSLLGLMVPTAARAGLMWPGGRFSTACGQWGWWMRRGGQ